MLRNLRELPKVRDGWSYLYVEHCRVDKEDKAIAVMDADGITAVPCAVLSLLMLGPGTVVTHAAIRTLAESGCLVAWTGEEGARFYAQGLGESASSRGLIRQAMLCSDPGLRLQVVMRMYRMRFPEPLPDGLTLQQIRGREGIRVRDAYARASEASGIPWTGRNYNRSNWGAGDPVNRALSAANACLYGVCHAAIVALGYSPGLGFVHTGKSLSFVYDVADLYKMETTVPVAFAAAALGSTGIEQNVRKACRDYFAESRLLGRITEDLNGLMDLAGLDIDSTFDKLEADSTTPGGIWNPDGGELEGGVNYAPPEAAEASSEVAAGDVEGVRPSGCDGHGTGSDVPPRGIAPLDA